MTTQSPVNQEEIVSEIVKELISFLSFSVYFIADTTIIWYAFNHLIEYPITWQFAAGCIIVFKFIKRQ